MIKKVLLATALISTVCNAVSLSEYSGSWEDSFNLKIQKALVKNHVRGCGEYKYKKHNEYDEYLVSCTRDGKKWVNYIVYPTSGEILRAN